MGVVGVFLKADCVAIGVVPVEEDCMGVRGEKGEDVFPGVLSCQVVPGGVG